MKNAYRKYKKPYRVKKSKPLLKKKFFWLAVLIVSLSGGLFYLIFFASAFQIANVEIEGDFQGEPSIVESIINKEVSKKIIFFSTKSIFLADLHQANQDIQNRFPQINEVILQKDFPSSVKVVLQERKPFALFSAEPDWFFLDSQGIIFAKADVPASNMLQIKKKGNDETPVLGAKIFEKEELAKIGEMKDKLKADLQIETKYFTKESAENFIVETQEGWKIYFNPKGDVDWQFTKLGALLKQKIPAEKRQNLEYIELRFGNYAPFKYRFAN